MSTGDGADDGARSSLGDLADAGLETPHRRPHAPRRPEIGFRLGRQGQLHRWMASRLGETRATPKDGPTVGRLSTRDPGLADTSGFVDALLSAWSAVGDNLTFYQERIAQEGYLRTATESLSVRALLAGLGSAPDPATSASTFLAFTLLEARGGPTSVAIPGGVGVQSLPAGGRPSVVFETNVAMEARPEWNAVRLAAIAPERAAAIIGGETTRLQVKGGRQLQPGMALVVQDASDPDAAPQVRLLTDVDPQTDGTCWLSWRSPLAGMKSEASRPALYVCTRAGRLFGASAAPWSGVADTIKARCGTRRGTVARSMDGGGSWTSVAAGLPPGEVRAAATDSDGALYVCVDDTVLRWISPDGWIVAGTPSPRSDIQVLRTGPHDRLFAGVARGEVMVSSDAGRSWSPLTAPTGEPISHGALPRLPQSPVLDILLMKDGRQIVAVATNVGVWTTPMGGGEWTAWNEGLPGAAVGSRPGATAVRALFKTKFGGVVAATEAGLFHAMGPGSRWRLTTPEEGFAVCETPQGELAAATATGVMLSSDQGLRWRRAHALPEGAGPITRVVAGKDRLMAAGPSGVFVSEGGGAWSIMATPPLSGTLAAALFDLGAQGLVAAERFQGYAEDEWPGLGPLPGPGAIIDLDRAYPGVAPSGWAVLTPDRLSPVPAAANDTVPADDHHAKDAEGGVALAIQDASVAARNDFGLSGRVTRLRVAALPAGIDPRTTSVHVSSTVVDLVPAFTIKPQRLERLSLGVGDGVGSSVKAAIRLDGDFANLAGRAIAITGRRPRVRITMQTGGVRAWNPDATSWTPIAAPGDDVRSIWVSPKFGLLVGGELDVLQVALSREDGAEAAGFGAAPLGTPILALAEVGDAVLAGGATGLWRARRGEAWTSCGLGEVAVTALAAIGGKLAAGTLSGLHLSDNEGRTWRSASGLAATVSAVVESPKGRWIAATQDGRIFVESGLGFEPATTGPTACRINALCVQGTSVLAGADQGLFESKDDGATWTLRQDGETTGDVRAIAVGADGAVWTAVYGRGLMRNGALVFGGVCNHIAALAFDGQGALLAAARNATALLRADGVTDADITTPKPVGRLVDPRLKNLLQTGPAAPELTTCLATLGVTAPSGGSITRRGDGVWVLGGESAGSILMAVLNDGAVRVAYEPDLFVTKPEQPSAAGEVQLGLQTAGSVDVSLRASPGELTYLDATDNSSAVAEVAYVADATPSSDRLTTEICFSEPLANVYDMATVTINANVVAASHGETPVSAEVLGNGDNSIPNQSFTLKTGPLSTPDPALQPVGGPRHAIEIRVRTGSPNDTLSLAAQLLPSDLRSVGQLWQEVATFDKSGPLDLHYKVMQAIDGSIQVVFGDGRNGRRLPTGYQNIVALYRVGAGAAGDVRAGQLTMPKQRQAGVKSVTNPVAAVGGSDAQDVKQTRATGPIQARALSRIVSSRDFEGYALTRPSIAKSLGTDRAAAGGAPGVLLTVATLADATIAVGGAVAPDGLAELNADIRSATAWRPALTLARARLSWFDLEAELELAPAVVLSGASTLKAAQAALKDSYGFSMQTLGASVRAAAVIARLQAVPGVAAVNLISLNRRGRAPTLDTRIEAAPARIAAGAALGAELLVLASAKLTPRGASTSSIRRAGL